MNYLLFLLVRGYQRFLRPFHSRRCIYKTSCSNFACEILLANQQTPWENCKEIAQRIQGCGISSIHVERTLDECKAFNLHKEEMALHELTEEERDHIKALQRELSSRPIVPLEIASSTDTLLCKLSPSSSRN